MKLECVFLFKVKAYFCVSSLIWISWQMSRGTWKVVFLYMMLMSTLLAQGLESIINMPTHFNIHEWRWNCWHGYNGILFRVLLSIKTFSLHIFVQIICIYILKTNQDGQMCLEILLDLILAPDLKWDSHIRSIA